MTEQKLSYIGKRDLVLGAESQSTTSSVPRRLQFFPLRCTLSVTEGMFGDTSCQYFGFCCHNHFKPDLVQNASQKIVPASECHHKCLELCGIEQALAATSQRG